MRTEIGGMTEGEIAVAEFLRRYEPHTCASRYEPCHEPGMHIIPRGDPFAPLTPHEQRLEQQRGRKASRIAWQEKVDASRKRALEKVRGKQ